MPKSKKTGFTERDIKIQDMLSRIGKATENAHLPLAKVRKMEQQAMKVKTKSDMIKKKMDKIQN